MKNYSEFKYDKEVKILRSFFRFLAKECGYEKYSIDKITTELFYNHSYGFRVVFGKLAHQITIQANTWSPEYYYHHKKEDTIDFYVMPLYDQQEIFGKVFDYFISKGLCKEEEVINPSTKAAYGGYEIKYTMLRKLFPIDPKILEDYYIEKRSRDFGI